MQTSDKCAGGLTWLLRAEALAILLLSLWAYGHLNFNWGQFALLFLLPDLALLAYLIQPRIGAMCYNATHSEVGALVLLFAGWALHLPAVQALSLIWLAHIGFDRALGYGLKRSTGFAYTHLGMIGRKPRSQPEVKSMYSPNKHCIVCYENKSKP